MYRSILFLFVFCFHVGVAKSWSYSPQINLLQTAVSDSVITVQIKVQGLTCASDLKTISKNVSTLKGVQSCEPQKLGTTSRFLVVYRPDLISFQEIVNAIENTEGCENPDDRPYKVKKK